MTITDVPFGIADWNSLPCSVHPGESGVAHRRTVEVGNVRIRMVEYSPGYRADHWCSRGHVIVVLEGELTTEIQGGPAHILAPSMSYHVSDGSPSHRSSTSSGALLFAVD
jgi:hypothetical protein